MRMGWQNATECVTKYRLSQSWYWIYNPVAIFTIWHSFLKVNCMRNFPSRWRHYYVIIIPSAYKKWTQLTCEYFSRAGESDWVACPVSQTVWMVNNWKTWVFSEYIFGDDARDKFQVTVVMTHSIHVLQHVVNCVSVGRLTCHTLICGLSKDPLWQSCDMTQLTWSHEGCETLRLIIFMNSGLDSSFFCSTNKIINALLLDRAFWYSIVPCVIIRRFRIKPELNRLPHYGTRMSWPPHRVFARHFWP